jgi:hypothetical protein
MLMLCLLQPASVAIAQTEAERDQYAAIEIMRLQHRDANLIRTAVMSALNPRGSIGLIDNNLIVASTRANLRELRTLIQQLDLPRQALLISIDFDFSDRVSENIQSVQILDGDMVIIQEQQPVLNTDLLINTQTDSAVDIAADSAVASGIDSAINGAIDSAIDSAAAPGQQVAMALSTRAEIRGSQIYVTLQNATPAADQVAENRAVTTSLSVTSGQWVVVNPLAAVIPAADDDTADTVANASVAGLRQLAVRVDLLP